MKRWRKMRFQFRWPEEERSPHTFLDLVVAHLVVADVVRKHDLRMWRVHRRWARDANGHEFAFSFYESEETSEELFGEIRSSAVVLQLLKDGFLEEEPQVDVGGTEIGAEAEPHWPQQIRDAWPFYIHGVSQMWLTLIESQVREPVSEAIDKALLEQFHAAEQDVCVLWRNCGCHALLHHLNAMFGGTLVSVSGSAIRF